jgi:glycosyltransferase involved in cell wall biosynthesis
MTGTPNGPTISVIIPAYNAAGYIGQAVSSALASQGVAFEVLVIDDQSTDDTWRILEGFGDAISKVRIPKGGPYKARNHGARLARGEWLAFLDADDEWAPDKLVKQLAAADEQTGLVYTDRFNIGDCSRVKARQSDSVRLSEGDVFEPLLLGNFITLSSVLMRKSWFDRLGGFSETAIGVQDWDLWLRFAAEGGIVKLLREPLTRYRLHADQMSHSQDTRAAEREAVVLRALHSPRGQRVSWTLARQARASVWEIGAWQTAPFLRWKAIKWYARAAYYWPWNLRLYKGIVKCCLGLS